MLKTIDRLMQFIQHAGLSARQFDLSIGASNGYTLRMKKNRASIGSDVIENILKIYPQLNVVWLLTGEGTMLKEDKTSVPLGYDQLPREKQQEIEELIEKKIREKQREELERLMEEVRSELRK
ncbi:hypothetical protein [Muriicola marianensis]|uniref:XRE family transcriptional regulator n=1 Tax=Muriicola marianensis TaxID=1324801 RepID=A0ABQ1QPX7_9FLAO|nr:hypothetical protein [Muriicola marianensis]GGD38438.1 hypothetical protein GCM10011361_01970 [Muriicola marianensis]